LNIYIKVSLKSGRERKNTAKKDKVKESKLQVKKSKLLRKENS
jgi:hypothetical protein